MNERKLTDEGAAAMVRAEQLLTEMEETKDQAKLDALQVEFTALLATKVYQDALAQSHKSTGVSQTLLQRKTVVKFNKS